MQGLTGGVNGTTWTVAVAWLLLVFDSGLSPDTATTFVCGPAWDGVVISVIVTDSPTAISPIVQCRIGPPVQLPLVMVAETNVFPVGIGSEIVTPVSASGPLFVTTIVQVMLPSPRVCWAGEPDFVIDRSTSPWMLNGSHALQAESVWFWSSPATYIAWNP